MKHLFLISMLVWLCASHDGNCQSSVAEEYADYPQAAFDNDTCCWRLLAADEKYLDAAELIKMYLHSSTNISNKHSLHWHLGQMLAKAGQLKEAKHYFKKTYTIFYRWFGGPDGRAWYLYAKGSVAFLDRDKKELIQILNKWPEENRMDKNYLMLHALFENWEKPY